MNLLDHLNSARKSLFRFEGLQEYDVAHEKDMVESFMKTGVVDTYRMQNWWKLIEDKTKAGVRMERVRLVEEPYTDYTKMELEIHKMSAQKGDHIYLIRKEEYEKSHATIPDFWVIDDQKVLIMNYGNKGEYLGFTVAEEITSFLKTKEFLLLNSESSKLT